MSSKITLNVTEGALKGTEFELEEHNQYIVGRAEDCDIALPRDIAHVDVSRHHCAFEFDPPALLVRDLGSLNGTYVNGERIGPFCAGRATADSKIEKFASRELMVGDEVQVGSTVFQIDLAVADDERDVALVPMYFV